MTGRHARRFWLPALFVLGNAIAAPALSAETGAQSRADAVGQVVMGILSYARWPQQPDVIRLCVVGDPAYANALLDGTASPVGLPVRIGVALPDSSRLAEDCDAVYLGGLNEARRQKVLQHIVGRPVLSIVEDDAECAVGAMFCLDVGPERVRFQVNLDSVTRSGVRINPNVLQLSRRRPSP
ncbi:YfiR family protein [Bordetella flabilis]|uniref:DUF4154 domain-containing protein n=1 Tax=Bordetella flabilis TaxID=463014 RepID=A0A193GJ82_9BORD|nr:YfiR family protein [Bordetella flabilis]ANN79329.1 hypothetical protein BAU07_21345 [Bordetella flabilis]